MINIVMKVEMVEEMIEETIVEEEEEMMMMMIELEDGELQDLEEIMEEIEILDVVGVITVIEETVVVEVDIEVAVVDIEVVVVDIEAVVVVDITIEMMKKKDLTQNCSSVDLQEMKLKIKQETNLGNTVKFSV